MDALIRSEFEKHLKKVCKDKELRQYALEFFEDLSKKYAGQVFTKDNFETLVINGEEVEQDVVKAIFNNKQTSTAEEIFLYLFKNNIHKLAFFTSATDLEDGSVGVVSATELYLGIKKRNLSEFCGSVSQMVEPIKPVDVPEKEWKKTRKKQRREFKAQQKTEAKELEEKAYRDRSASYHHSLYHELGHVFELKTFAGRKHIKNNMSTRVVTQLGKDDCVSSETMEITSEQIAKRKELEDLAKQGQLPPSTETFIENMYDVGANAISEILNEIYASEIEGSLEVSSGLHCSSFGSKFYRKAKMEGDCGYNSNQDIATLFKLALGETDVKNLRFNSKLIINEINNLKISEEDLNLAKQQLIELMKQKSTSEKDMALAEDIAKELQKCDVFSTIGVIMGVGKFVTNDKQQCVEDYKIIVQSLLVKGIFNNITEQLADESVVKDEAFFEKINATLIEIDSSLHYPNQMLAFQRHGRTVRYTERFYEQELDVSTIETLAKNHPEYTHISTFASLVKEVKQYVNKECVLTNIGDIMTYLQQQAEIDNKYKQIVEEQEKAIKEKEEAERKEQEEWQKRRNTQHTSNNNFDYGEWE